MAEEVGAGNVDISLASVGAQASRHPVNSIYLWTDWPCAGHPGEKRAQAYSSW
jgi:hypothetical protein